MAVRRRLSALNVRPMPYMTDDRRRRAAVRQGQRGAIREHDVRRGGARSCGAAAPILTVPGMMFIAANR
jgi:hypothetical protein